MLTNALTIPVILPVLLGLAAPAHGAGAAPDHGFALRLYRRLAVGTGNAFLSPYSVSSALAMSAEGARGETARQMAMTLGGPPDAIAGALAPVTKRVAAAGGAYELSAANALWVERSFPLRPAFVEAATKRWSAGVFDLDFRGAAEPSRQRINRWVEERTRERIRDLIPAGAVNPMTRLVLTNAVYFKGRWRTPFRPDRTEPKPFTRADGSKVSVPMMSDGALHAGYAALAGVRVLEMIYEGGDLSMVVILPDRTGGLAAVERKLDAPALSHWLGALGDEQVDVLLPRFELETEYELEPALSALGMPVAFDAGKADFGGIAGTDGGDRLCISAAIHKAFVEVKEEGTEAAAATGTIMATAVMPPPEKPKPRFHADHPFLFLIRDRASGTILFIGRVGDPAGR